MMLMTMIVKKIKITSQVPGLMEVYMTIQLLKMLSKRLRDKPTLEATLKDGMRRIISRYLCRSLEDQGCIKLTYNQITGDRVCLLRLSSDLDLIDFKKSKSKQRNQVQVIMMKSPVERKMIVIIRVKQLELLEANQSVSFEKLMMYLVLVITKLMK